MSLATLVTRPAACLPPERFGELDPALVQLAQQQPLAGRVLRRMLELPPVTAPAAELPPLDWRQGLANLGLAAWAPSIRRVVAREQIRQLIGELGAADYRRALGLPPLAQVETRSLPTPLPQAVRRSGRRLLAGALAQQGAGWPAFACQLLRVAPAQLQPGAGLAELLTLLTHTTEPNP